MTCPGAHSLDRAELGLCPQMSCLSERKSSGAASPPGVPQFPLPLGEWQDQCWGPESLGQEGVTGSVVTDSGAGDGGQARVPRQGPAAQEPVRLPAGQQAGGPLGCICAGHRPGEPLQGKKLDGGQSSSEAPQAMLVLWGGVVVLEEPCGDGEGEEPLQLTATPDPSLESVAFRLTLVHTLRYSDPTYQ